MSTKVLTMFSMRQESMSTTPIGKLRSRFAGRDISSLIALAVTFAMLSSFIELLLSFHYSLPSGPAIILVNSIVYGMSLMFGPVGGIVNQVFFNRQVKV